MSEQPTHQENVMHVNSIQAAEIDSLHDALTRMQAQLLALQNHVDEQSITAGKVQAKLEAERDAAIADKNEADRHLAALDALVQQLVNALEAVGIWLPGISINGLPSPMQSAIDLRRDALAAAAKLGYMPTGEQVR